MFTGIIETTGKVDRIVEDLANRHYLISSSISHELKIDQSLSHNGVCLTVTKVVDQSHWVTVIDETRKKSSFDHLTVGSLINLERSMVANGRFDGHIVQGHVDQTAICKSIKEIAGSWLFDFEYDPALGNVTVEKGSIAINGVSLTCFNSRKGSFSVAIIPYTFENTNFKAITVGDTVNLEFDLVGKYIRTLIQK